MARAARKHTPKRTSRRKTSRQSGRGSLPPNCQAIEDVFFRQWRDLFGSERALQHLEDTLRSKPSWHVSTSGKVVLADIGFWLRTTLSIETTADGVDCLALRYTPYAHEPDYPYDGGRFFLRTVDIIECEERLGGNDVISDYDPIAEFEREKEGRPRTLARLSPMTVPPAPDKELTPLEKSVTKAKLRKAKPRKPKQPRKRNTADDALVAAPGKEPTSREKYKRFTADDDLVAEGVNGIRIGTWPNPSQAATALADRAKGSSLASTTTRLRKKIGKKIGTALEG